MAANRSTERGAGSRGLREERLRGGRVEVGGHAANILGGMRIAIVTLVVLVIGCGGRADDAKPADRAAVDQLLEEFGTPGPRDSALVAPRLITGPTLVVFWLAAADTLHPDDAASALDDMNYYTEQIMPRLTGWGVALVPTNADTLYIALPNDKRRAVLLTGLELPFGYVIAEPGGVERILPGVYAAEELIEEIQVYFDLEDDTTVSPEPKVITE